MYWQFTLLVNKMGFSSHLDIREDYYDSENCLEKIMWNRKMKQDIGINIYTKNNYKASRQILKKIVKHY